MITPPRSSVRFFLRQATLFAAALWFAAPGASATVLGLPSTVIGDVTPESWIHVADLDQDGDGDLLYSPAPGRLDLLRRASDGSFSALPIITGGVSRVLRAVAADVDLDGRLDVIAYVQLPSGDAGIRVIRQGLFNAFLTSSAVDLTVFGVPSELAPLECADLNGDGLPDLLISWKTTVTGADKGRVGYFRNTGSGTFSTINTLVFQVFDAPCSLAICDVNRDGKPDILVADNTKKELLVFKGPAYSARETTSLSHFPRHFTVGDQNRDGWPDLMVAYAALGTSGGAGLRTLLGSAAGFTAAVAPFTSVPFAADSSLLAADLNLDGAVDYVVAGRYSGNAQAVLVLDRGNDFPQVRNSPLMPGPIGAAAAFDDDADGDPDLFCVTATGVVRIENKLPHRAISATTTAVYSADGTAPDGASCYATADFNRDGRGDAVCASNSDGKIRLYLNNGGKSITTVNVADNAGCRWVAAGDVDGDGDMDIIAPSLALNRVVWYANNGSGGGWTPNVIPSVINMPMGIAVGDVNQDGLLDIVTSSVNQSSVILLTNSQNGTAWSATTVGNLGNVLRLEIADLIPGLRPEVLVQHGAGGTVSRLRFNGGVWGTATVIPSQSSLGGEGLAVADLDGNGLLDVIAGSYGTAWVAYQTSFNTFAPPALALSGADAWFDPVGTIRSVRTADIDLDGRPDVVGVFDKGILIKPSSRPQIPGFRLSTHLAKNAVNQQSDVALIRFNQDAVFDVLHRDPSANRVMAEMLQTPVLTITATPYAPFMESAPLPVQSTSHIPLFRLRVVHAGWGSDAPVHLDSLAVRFRQDTGAFAPMEAAFFTPAFSSFLLYADGGEDGLLLDAAQDPHVASLTAVPPDAQGRSILPLAPAPAVGPGTSQFFLTAMVNTPYLGPICRIDLPWFASGSNSSASAVFPAGITEPLRTMSSSGFVRLATGQPTSRQSWRWFHFNSGGDMGNAANYADPDGDGIPNILEYALGLNPKVPDRNPITQISPAFNSIFLSFNAVEVQPDTALQVFSTVNLTNWTPRASRQANGSWSTQQSTVLPGNPAGSLLQQVFSATRAPGGKEFFRLEAYELAP